MSYESDFHWDQQIVNDTFESNYENPNKVSYRSPFKKKESPLTNFVSKMRRQNLANRPKQPNELSPNTSTNTSTKEPVNKSTDQIITISLSKDAIIIFLLIVFIIIVAQLSLECKHLRECVDKLTCERKSQT